MSVDDLINKALRGSGGVLETSNLFAVVGDVQTHELFVMNLKDFFSQNMLSLLLKETASAILLGIYGQEEQARECIKTLREESHHAEGLIGKTAWHIIIGNSDGNKLFSISLKDYYIGSVAFFTYKIDSGNLPIAIVDSADAADAAIDLLRIAE